MNRKHSTGNWLVTALAALAFVAGAASSQEAPPVLDLLRTLPFDRITLTDNSVLNVEPVSPRPLPVLDPSKDRSGRGRGGPKPGEIPPEGNIGLPGGKKKAEKEEEKPLTELTIHLLQGEVRDYTLKRTNIKNIEYFEDMLLAEGDRYLLAHDFARAFECFLRVQSRSPRWPGLAQHVNRALFAEGSAALLDGEGERGLRLLGELSGRQPDFPGLADRLATAYGSRIDRAFELSLFARGRKILHDLGQLAPGHTVVKDERERFIARAKEKVLLAEKSRGAERLDRLTESLRVWPDLEGSGALYNEAFKATPTLDVAVRDLPRGVGPWVRSPADERVSRLLFLPILARDDEESFQGKQPGQLAEGIETADLGRRLVLRVRSDVQWSDGSRPVSAIDVARALTDRIEPTSTLYNARWADLLDRVDVPEPNRLEIRLTRPFLRPGLWLMGPVGPAHAGFDGRVATLDQGRVLVGDGAFHWVDAAGHAELRSLADSGAPSGNKIKRIREVAMPTGKAAIGALLRGEVSLIEHVAPDRVAALAANPELKVGRYSRPSLHWIALDGRNPALRNRALRRGLSYAIDRKGLLEETLLHRSAENPTRISDGPFPFGSYANAPDVRPLSYDPLLARMLVAAAQKELTGQAIALTFQYPAIPEAQAVAPKIAESLRLVGVSVTLTERPESELEADLRAGKQFDLAYRALRCDEPVLEAGPLICPGYDARPEAGAIGSVASPRILQLLLLLERAPEWPTAKGIILQIDRECRDELPIVPLWQLEDHYAWRSRLKGPGEVADHLYQGIETWEIEPWFAPRFLVGPILWLLAGGAALQADTSEPAIPIDRQPYAIKAHLAVDPAARIDRQGRAILLYEWDALVRRFVGAPWDLSVAEEEGPLTTLPLESLLPAAFEEAGQGRDKVWTLRIEAEGAGFALSGREFDSATGKLGPIHRRSAPYRPDLPRELLALALEVFSPSALIGESFAKHVSITVRGASLETASPIGRVVKVGSVFQPLRLVPGKGKGGKTLVLEVPFSYLQVETLEGPVARCTITSIYPDPLTKRMVQANSFVALGLKAGKTPTHLRFVTKPDKVPAAGYVLTARTIPDGFPREVGMTDREGRIVIPTGFADGLVILRLLAGNIEPMVEFPAMPGEFTGERTVPIEPRPQTVAFETQLDSIRDAVIDLVAIRARLEARLKARLDGEDWAGIEASLNEFSHLPARETFAEQLTKLKDEAARLQAKSKTAILTKTAQAELADVQNLVERYLEDEAFNAYREALERSRREPAAAKPKPAPIVVRPAVTKSTSGPAAGDSGPTAAKTAAPARKPAPGTRPF